MIYSPLRYPGGKGRLTPLIKLLIEKTGHFGGVYIEPFAGGAGVALNLLVEDCVSDIVINDLDKGVYSFWRSVIDCTDRFVEDIMNVPLTMEEWRRQKKIRQENEGRYSYELGFATFYLNRTNRSGIIGGGVIGGNNQDGKWRMDARFNRHELAEKVRELARRRNNIHVYNKDVISLINRYVTGRYGNCFIYFDPPYYDKGGRLYLNHFEHDDHERLSLEIKRIKDFDWVMTYDDNEEITKMYDGVCGGVMTLRYSLNEKRKALERIYFSDSCFVPTEDELNSLNLSIEFN